MHAPSRYCLKICLRTKHSNKIIQNENKAKKNVLCPKYIIN